MFIKTILILLIAFGSLYAKKSSFKYYKNGNIVNLRIEYLNTNHFKLKDAITGKNYRKKGRNRKFYKDFVTYNPITIFNYVDDVNTFDYLGAPANPIYTDIMKYNTEDYNSRAVILKNNEINEFLRTSIISFTDNENIFPENKIQGLLINKKYIIYIVQFSEDVKNNKEYINKVKNLKYVVDWTRKKLHIKRSNIAFIGSFGLSYDYLKNKLFGFKPALKIGNRIVKVGKNKFKLKQSENVLIAQTSVFEARTDFLIVKNGKRRNQEISKYINGVSNHYPINLYIKNFKLKKFKR